jgi:E3 ubiquitin-protein ligase XIAP
MFPGKDLELTSRPKEEESSDKKEAEIIPANEDDDVCNVSMGLCHSSKGNSIPSIDASFPSSSSNVSSVNDDDESYLCRITDLSSTSIDVLGSPTARIASLPDEIDHPTDISRRIEEMSSEKRIFRFAKNRLKTFQENDWPHHHEQPRIEEMAEAAFLLKRDRAQKDQVECVFCGIKVSKWTPDMDPFTIHSQRSPRCDFIMGYNVDNVPLDGNLSSDPIRGPHRRTYFREPDICGSSPSPSSQSGGSSPVSDFIPFVTGPLNEVEDYRPARHPDLVTFESRFRSFPPNWSSLCSVDASRLSEAGFFFIGGPAVGVDGETKYDVVECFHCGRRACEWKPEDDPWFEHKKLFRNCIFLKLNIETYRPTMNPSSPTDVTISSSSSQPTVNQASTSKTLSTSSGSISCPTTTPKDTESISTISLASQLSSLATDFHRTTLETSADQGRCKICYTREVEILFLPCKHANCCAECATAVNKCPYCRTPLEGVVRIYLS